MSPSGSTTAACSWASPSTFRFGASGLLDALESAIVNAVVTSGRAVLFAGAVVCVALLGLAQQLSDEPEHVAFACAQASLLGWAPGVFAVERLTAGVDVSERAEELGGVRRFMDRALGAGFACGLVQAGDRAGLVQWLAEGKQVRDALGT